MPNQFESAGGVRKTSKVRPVTGKAKEDAAKAKRAATHNIRNEAVSAGELQSP